MEIFKARFLTAFIAFVLCQNVVFAQIANDYSFIKPGLSLKRDIETQLGDPLEEIIPGTRYRYSSDHYALRFMDVIYNRDTGLVDYFVLYFKPGIYKEDARLYFNLDEPIRRRYNHEGGLVEVYFPQGIFLNYLGTGNNSAVDKVEIVSSLFFELLAEQKYAGYIDDYVYGAGMLIENEPFTGVKVSSLDENGPAKLAGIQVDDVILEIEDFIFVDPENIERFKKTVRHLPINQNLRIRVLRDRVEIDLYISLAELSDSEKIIISLNDLRISQLNPGNQFLPIKSSLYDVKELVETIKAVDGDLPPGVNLDEQFLDELGDKYNSEKIINESLPSLYFDKDPDHLKGVPFLDFGTIRYFDKQLLLRLSIAFIKSKKYSYALEILYKLLEYNKRDHMTVYLIAYSHDMMQNAESAALFYGNLINIKETPNIIKDYAINKHNMLTK